jgi:predicted nucleotidyltransferase
MAVRTGHLGRFVIFGSYVTAKPDPKDVDVILVMDDDFHQDEMPLEMQGLFDHAVV